MKKKPYSIPLNGEIGVSGEKYYVNCTKESEEVLGQYVFGYGDTEEAAVEEFWKSFELIHKYYFNRARKCERWIPLEIGNWKNRGGKWFTTFGIHVYFRYGDNMKGGKYIPLTKLNIMVTNYWTRKIED